MKIIIKVHRDEVLERQYLPVYRLIKNNRWRWQAVGASLSLSGGILSPLAGIALNLLVSYTRLSSERPFLYKLSIIFYIVSVPLLMLGAHFLDLLDHLEPEVLEADSIKQTIGHLGLPAKAEDF